MCTSEGLCHPATIASRSPRPTRNAPKGPASSAADAESSAPDPQPTLESAVMARSSSFWSTDEELRARRFRLHEPSLMANPRSRKWLARTSDLLEEASRFATLTSPLVKYWHHHDDGWSTNGRAADRIDAHRRGGSGAACPARSLERNSSVFLHGSDGRRSRRLTLRRWFCTLSGISG
jgi:hypothetical protein